MALIEVDHLVKDFPSVRAVDDLSFGIDGGTIAGFLGPNGSGKTTTLLTLLGLVAASSGEATIGGRRYSQLADPLHEVGAMLEATAHPARSGRGHLRILAAEARVPRSRVDDLLAVVELGAAADRAVGGYSLGMRQRLGLAGALIGDPQILVLDEPANGLDPEGIRWLRDFLRSLAADGRTILLSSHVLSEVAQTVDEVVVISRGRLVVHAPLDQVTGTSAVRVLVRSPEIHSLAAALAADGIDSVTSDGELAVVGASQEAVGRLAFDRGIVLYGLTTEASSLEDVFLSLTTADSAEVFA